MRTNSHLTFFTCFAGCKELTMIMQKFQENISVLEVSCFVRLLSFVKIHERCKNTVSALHNFIKENF